MVIDLVVTAPSGLHARPAANFVKTVQQFVGTVTVRWHGGSADGYSILDVLKLGVPAGAHIEVDLDGDDASELAAALARLAASRFEVVPEPERGHSSATR